MSDEETTSTPQPEPKPVYWQASLEDGTTISESESTWDALKASGKTAHVTALTLCTPVGDYTLTTGLPDALFPFNNAQGQGIARIENSAGQCVCALWDEVEQKLVPEAFFHVNELSS